MLSTYSFFGEAGRADLTSACVAAAGEAGVALGVEGLGVVGLGVAGFFVGEEGWCLGDKTCEGTAVSTTGDFDGGKGGEETAMGAG